MPEAISEKKILADYPGLEPVTSRPEYTQPQGRGGGGTNSYIAKQIRILLGCFRVDFTKNMPMLSNPSNKNNDI